MVFNSHTYTLQIIIQGELENLTTILEKINFKDIQFPVNIKDIYKIEKKNYIGSNVCSYENKEKYPINISKNVLEKKMLIYY